MANVRAAMLLLLCVVLQLAVGFLNSPGGIHTAARCGPSAAICAVLILLSPHQARVWHPAASVSRGRDKAR